MVDEFGVIIQKGDYGFDYEIFYDIINKRIKDFNLKLYEDLYSLGSGNIGMNALDLFCLKFFFEENNIQNVLELGCGTTSKFLDILKIQRKTFALDCIYFEGVEYEKLNLFEEYQTIQKYVENNIVEFILVDCLHNEKMAELIFDKILKLSNFNTPIFIHDWFDFNKETYTEQVYYYNNLFKFYDLYLMTDLPKEFIDKLQYDKNSVDEICHVPRCCAILTPKTWKM